MPNELNSAKGQRVRHKFRDCGTLVTGNIRRRDQRLLVTFDDGERLWCAVEFLENVQ